MGIKGLCMVAWDTAWSQGVVHGSKGQCMVARGRGSMVDRRSMEND